MPTTITGESMLLDWSDTAKGGPKVVFALPTSDDLDPFRSLTLAKGKMAGQRFMYALALIGDVEIPPPVVAPGAELKGGPLAQLAGIWANDKEFQDWILKYHPPTRSRRELAEIATREVCGVTSRKQLDHDDAAKARFNTFICEPFMAVKKEMDQVKL